MPAMHAAAADPQRAVAAAAVAARTRTAAPAARAVMANRATSMSATTASPATVRRLLRRAARCSTRLAMSARTAISHKVSVLGVSAVAAVNDARPRSTAMLCGLLVRRVTARKVIARAATGLRVIVRKATVRAPTVRMGIARAVTVPKATVRKARAVKAVAAGMARAAAKVYPRSRGAEISAPRDLHHGQFRAVRLVRRQWITSNHHRLTNPGPA